MMDSSQADTTPQHAESLDGPVVAYVETDRFCVGCGYNLRTTPVIRDTRLDVLLCRCTECGKIQHAVDLQGMRHVWLARVGTAIAVGWILIVLWTLFWYVFAMGALPLVVLEGMTRWTSGGRVPYDSGFYAFQTFMVILAFALPVTGISLATAAFHHWPRWTYQLAAVGIPVLACSLIYWTWRVDLPALASWSIPFLVRMCTAELLGGLLAARYGRSIVRGLLTMLLPSRPRQVFAFLWLVDGKQLPLRSQVGRQA